MTEGTIGFAEGKSAKTEDLAKRTDRLDVKTQYDLDPDDYREIFYNNHECFMAHISPDGYPMVSPMWYVVIDGMVHISTIKDLRKKTAALMRNPKMSLILTNFSVRASDVKAALKNATITTEVLGRYLVPLSRIDAIKAILIKADAEISEDRSLRATVARTIVDKYYPNESPERREELLKAVDTPNRVVIKVHPKKIWNWDLGKMFEAAAE